MQECAKAGVQECAKTAVQERAKAAETLQQALGSATRLQAESRNAIEHLCRTWAFAGNDPVLEAAELWLTLQD